MTNFVRETLSLARRKAGLAAMLVMLAGYLAVTLAIPPDAKQTATPAATWLYEIGYVAVFIATEVFLVRFLARNAGLLGRPHYAIWLVALVVYGALMYTGAFCLQVLSYILLKDQMGSLPVEWHFSLMQPPIAVVLFPFTVWRCALLSGERSIGFLDAWTGTWSKRKYVLVIATIIYMGFTLLGLGLETLLGPDSAGLPEPISFALLLSPTVVGSVLAIVLSFVVVLRMRSEDRVTAPFD